MLLATTREKPRSRASASTSIGVARARNGARAERQRVGFGARGRQALVIAPQRRDVRQEEMRDQHRLRRAEVRERRHQRVAGRGRLRRQRGDDAGDAALQQRNAAPQVQPQIERHLLVARSAGMQPPAGVAEPLDEQALDEAVDVFVGAGDKRRIGAARARGCRSSATSICRPRRAAARRRAPSARAHARLPVTSSSNRRRSKRNDAPNSNAAASGAASNRPDHRVSSGSRGMVRCDPSESCLVSSCVRFETLRQRGGALAVARDDEDGVVAGDGPDRLGELGAIERLARAPAPVRGRCECTTSCCTRSTRRRNSDAARSSAVQRQLRARGIEPGPLIRAVAGALDEAEIRDVARDRRLRGLEAR